MSDISTTRSGTAIWKGSGLVWTGVTLYLIMTHDFLLRRAVTAALVAGTMAGPLGAAVDPAAERIAGSSPAEIRAELAAGADPEMRFSNGLTPLHYAARVGHLEAIRILVIEAGVDPNILSARNFVTPLHSASLRFDRKSASASETASLLISLGADIEAVTARGETPLHWAVFENDPELVALLLAAGADPLATNARGHAALGRALTHGSPEMIDSFLEAIALRGSPDSERVEKLHDAIAARHPELEDTPGLIRLHGLATGDAGVADTNTNSDTAVGDPETCSGWRVTEDDTRLSLIAQRALGAAARWSEIAELNNLRDGRNYQLGDCLRLP